MAVACTLVTYMFGLAAFLMIWAADLSAFWTIVMLAPVVFLWLNIVALFRAARGRGDEISEEPHHDPPIQVPPSAAGDHAHAVPHL
jgi:hypothetical protein